jgi:cyclic pyranopterin phosphate synthase
VLDNDTDAEGNALTAVLASPPAHAATFALNSDGTFLYMHDGSETAADSFTYKANDGLLDSNVVSVAITITPVNDAPQAVADEGYLVDEGGTIGFISPLSRNFCDGCNRVRVTCTGEMYLCLGQSAKADLRAPLRSAADDGPLDAAIDFAIGRKPRGHDFAIAPAGGAPSVERHMSVTGG